MGGYQMQLFRYAILLMLAFASAARAESLGGMYQRALDALTEHELDWVATAHPTDSNICLTQACAEIQGSPKRIRPALTVTPIVANNSRRAHEYLLSLQRANPEPRAAYLNDQPEAFCREWKWLMDSLKVSALVTTQGLPAEIVNDVTDCARMREVLQRIQQTPYSDPEYDLMRTLVEGRVRNAAAAMYGSAPTMPLIGTLPAPFLNAKAVRVPGTDEAVIIINDEVFRLPYGLSKTVLNAIDFKLVSGKYLQTLSADADVNTHLDGHPEVVRDYAFVILQYLHVASKVTDAPLPIDDDTKIVMMQFYYGLADAAEVFVVAHELAHTLLGHVFHRAVNLAVPTNMATGEMNANEVLYSWRDELEADVVGFAIMDAVLKADATERAGDWRTDALYSFYLSAPAFFFLGMSVVENFQAVINGDPPPTVTKEDIALVSRAIDQIGDQSQLPSATPNEPEQRASHPPFILRYGVAKVLAETAAKNFFAENKVPADTAQVYEMGPLFQKLLLMLGDRSLSVFRSMYANESDNKTPIRPSTDRGKVVVLRPNDLSSVNIATELKSRQVDVLDERQPASLRDAFVTYDYENSGNNLVTATPAGRKAASDLAKALALTKLRSRISVTTAKPGARVYFQLIARDSATPSGRLTNETTEDLTIGLYYIWTERGGLPTSRKADVFRVVAPSLRVDIEEVPSVK
jgi:hypothetical protein